MIFLLVFTLLFGAISLLTAHLITFGHPVTIAIGILWGTIFISALLILIRSFRRRSDDYRTGFSAMGFVVATGVPSLFYLPFGLASLAFHSEMLMLAGFSVAMLSLIAVMVGVFAGRWNWKVRTIELAFENLPADLDGQKIVQISDVHVGSFFRKYHKVEKAIDTINSLNADYVLFTGDLVNNLASEMTGWEPVFSRITANKGKYSILGNHDYGDYTKWENSNEKSANLQQLITIHRAIGFEPLLNESKQLSESENGAYLIGVENWGTGGFRKSGDLKQAVNAIPEDAFRILMSHDPSHFDAEIVGTGIELTLSGHTHGMQFGLERFGIKFSPVQWRYKKWAGLSQVGKQFLYVNRGFGYIGFPGRVGIYPEITEIILKKKP